MFLLLTTIRYPPPTRVVKSSEKIGNIRRKLLSTRSQIYTNTEGTCCSACLEPGLASSHQPAVLISIRAWVLVVHLRRRPPRHNNSLHLLPHFRITTWPPGPAARRQRRWIVAFRKVRLAPWRRMRRKRGPSSSPSLPRRLTVPCYKWGWLEGLRNGRMDGGLRASRMRPRCFWMWVV